MNLTDLIIHFNPGGKKIRVASIIPLTQKVVRTNKFNELHIVSFPDIDPNNYIYDSFIGGDVIIGEENGVENSILIGNGQMIKFGKFNSLQNLEAHGSDIREKGVEWGDGNFIAHRAIFHGCTGGNSNYLGVGTIIPDLSEVGSNNYFFHGSTISPTSKLNNHRGYKGFDVGNDQDYGDSARIMHFENQRTGKKTYLGDLFHDKEYKFMRNVIVPRTRHLLAHKSFELGGYLERETLKKPANGVMIHHVLRTSEYYLGVAARIVHLVQKDLADKVSKLQRIYSILLDGYNFYGLSLDDLIQKEKISNNQLDSVWKSRKDIYNRIESVFNRLTEEMRAEVNSKNYIENLPAQPDKRFVEYESSQSVLIIALDHDDIPFMVQTISDLKKCFEKLQLAETVISNKFI